MAVRAQYGPGHAGGEDVPGYLEEEGVPEDSITETYAALRLEVDNWRWAGVPFYLRTGKRLARKVTEIAVTLKPVPHLAFSQDGSLGVQPNQLVLTLQPNEGVSLRLGAKIPGTRMIIRPVNMEFLYGTAFLSQSPEAYERLITDAMRGDATLFTRNDEVEAQWRICDPIVSAWAQTPGPLPQYAAGSQGPEEAERAAARGRSLARDLMSATSDAVWSEQGTTPDAIEAALRELLIERHAENGNFVPARVLNMIAFVDREWSGEIANRLRGVGRYHASRLLVLAYEPQPRAPGRARDDRLRRRARAPGELALLRETVVVELGDRHLDDLLTIADPLVVTDLPTLLWSPHGHHEIVDDAAGAVPGGAARLGRGARRARRRWTRACALSAQALRRRPRVAALDAVARARRGDLRPAVAAPRAARDRARHRAPPPRLDRRGDAAASAGSASRLDWEVEPLARRRRRAARLRSRRRAGEVALRLEAAPELQVPGLEGVTIETASGLRLRLSRGPGGLRARWRDRRGQEREWTIPGASRGETGVLGEGIRQALLRDPTYVPALERRAARCCRDARLTHAAPTPRRVAAARAAAQRRARSCERRARAASAGVAHLALSGGTTPGAHLRAARRRRRRSSSGVEVWFADERCVGAGGRGEQLPARRRDAARAGGDRARARAPHGGRARPRGGRAPLRSRSWRGASPARADAERRGRCRCST